MTRMLWAQGNSNSNNQHLLHLVYSQDVEPTAAELHWVPILSTKNRSDGRIEQAHQNRKTDDWEKNVTWSDESKFWPYQMLQKKSSVDNINAK